MDTDALDAAEQVEHDAALHALVLAIRNSQPRQAAVDAVGVADAWEAEDDGARDFFVEVDDACD